MKMRLIGIAALVLSYANSAQATLIDRGGGMIYDTEQNITWLQDMSFAQTSGAYPIDRDHQFSAAFGWANSLVFGGYDDWRLPSGRFLNDYGMLPGETQSEYLDRMHVLNNLRSFDGSTDYGYNNIRSELGHLFAELGNFARYDELGNLQPGSGLTNTGPFINLQAGRYYEDVSFISWFGETYAWGFDFSTGEQNQFSAYLLNVGSFVTAVRDGDVAQVPAPAAVWLMLGGLIPLVTFGRRRLRS
jgi:hypothetical protein